MRFDAVLFDCDGVLVDSEPITNGVLHGMLNAQGWNLSAQDCFSMFVGHALIDHAALIEQRTGRQVTAQWIDDFRARRDAALSEHLEAVAHIHEAVDTLHAATHKRIACASGADRGKIALQLTKVKLLHYFEDRIFSGMEHARNKPHPDVYLTAAQFLGADPRCCAVVEDTVNGARAGLAAGATVFGYVGTSAVAGQAAALRALGVHHVFSDMRELPSLMA